VTEILIRARPVALVAFILWLVVPAFGQVHGLIGDTGGSPVAGAQIVAHNSLGTPNQVSTSAADGSFAMKDLKPGHYQFKAEKLGFADSAMVEQDVTTAGDLTLNLRLGGAEGFWKRLSQAYSDDWRVQPSAGRTLRAALCPRL